MKKIACLLFFCLSLILSACSDSNLDKAIVEKTHNLLPSVGFSINPTAVVIKDKLVLLKGEKRGVVFYEMGKEQILSKDSSSHQWLYYDGKTVYAIWWAVDQTKQKFLKIRTSADDGISFTPEVTVNSGTGVLDEISFASNGRGAVALAYTDERHPGYGVYLNYSNDSGKTWATQDLRLDKTVITESMKAANNLNPATFANSPHLTYVGDQLLAVWQQVDMTELGQSMLRIVSNTSVDNGKTWGTEATIFAAPNMAPVEIALFSNNKQVYIFAMLLDEKTGLTGFYPQDKAFTTWQTINNTGLGKDFNYKTIDSIRGAFSGDNLILSFISRSTDGVNKNYAATATLSTQSNKWLAEARQLDKDKGHDLTQSIHPNILSLGDEGVMVVWEDYRALIPSIYMDLSKDHGKTWLTSTQPLTTAGLTVAKIPELYLGKERLWMLYFMVNLDGKNPSGTHVYQEFTKNKDGQFDFPKIDNKMPSPEDLKERLIKRVNEFWVLREEKKWEETWAYMDPLYRGRFDKALWLAQQGKLSFGKTVADESSIDIKGNLALLNVNIEVSVNQQVSKEGLIESAPPNKQALQMKWGWFYDDWYYMPDMIFGKLFEY